jgi:hypothetical protein
VARPRKRQGVSERLTRTPTQSHRETDTANWTDGEGFFPRPSSPQAQHWLTRVAPEEYDRALARTPDVCRPFAAAMGDRRPARACLSEYRADQAHGRIRSLAATPDGARRLSLLARAVASRLAGGYA